MPTAVVFKDHEIFGMGLAEIELSPRQLQFHDRKFWDRTNKLWRIYGSYGGRKIIVPVVLYDTEDFNTARKLSDYIIKILNGSLVGSNGTLTINGASDRDEFKDCSFEGAQLVEGPKKDFGGGLGGGYWAIVVLEFSQLS